MKFYLLTLTLQVLIGTLDGLPRVRRTGGKVDIPSLVRAPAKLKKGETRSPPPGWTHCIINIPAVPYWRAISTSGFTKLKTTQFQCTWRISAESNQQVQLSVQKLTLGKATDSRCQQQFLEIIDNGKTQGRYCDKHKPGDYVTLGPQVRLDIQGEGTLANLVRAKKVPFFINYRSVRDREPGFRTTTSKIGSNQYDRYHTTTKEAWTGYRRTNPGINQNPANTWIENDRSKDNNKEDEDEDEVVKYGELTLAGLIAVVVCSALVLLLIILVLCKRFCCTPSKEPKEANEVITRENAIDLNVYPPPYTKHAYSLPGSEVIITSEVVRPIKSANSASNTSKKVSQTSVVLPPIIARKQSDQKVKSDKTQPTKPKPNPRKHHASEKSAEVKKAPSASTEKRRKRIVEKNNNDAPARRSRSTKSRHRRKPVDDEATSSTRKRKQKSERRSSKRSLSRSDKNNVSSKVKSSKTRSSKSRRSRAKNSKKVTDDTPRTRHRQ